MIVPDASVMVSALLGNSTARRQLADEELRVPALADVEIVSAMRHQVARQVITGSDAERALGIWRRFGVRRHVVNGLTGRMWELRHNLSAYDAAYVALAEALDCALVTADQGIVGAAGVRCPVVHIQS